MGQLDDQVRNEITQRIVHSPTGDYYQQFTNYTNPDPNDPWTWAIPPGTPVGGFVWNTDNWANDFDFSGLGHFVGAYGRWYNGTLLSPKHLITAEHVAHGANNHVQVNDPIHFIRPDGTLYTATVASLQQAGSYDVHVLQLDADVPSDITWYKVLPTDYADYFVFDGADFCGGELGPYDPANHSSISGKPCITTDQRRWCRVGVIDRTQSATVLRIDWVSCHVPDWWEYWSGVVAGDSGSGTWLPLAGELIYLGLHWTGGVNWIYDINFMHADTQSAVNTAMAALDPGGYQLTAAKLRASAGRLRKLRWPALLPAENEDDVEAVGVGLAGLRL